MYTYLYFSDGVNVFQVILIAARRSEIIGITEQLLSCIDNGDYEDYLLVKLSVSFVVVYWSVFSEAKASVPGHRFQGIGSGASNKLGE